MIFSKKLVAVPRDTVQNHFRRTIQSSVCRPDIGARDSATLCTGAEVEFRRTSERHLISRFRIVLDVSKTLNVLYGSTPRYF